MSRFARIIELEDRKQVLIVKSFDADADVDRHEIKITVEFESVRASINLGFNTEEEAANLLDTFTVEDAEKFRKAIGKNFN